MAEIDRETFARLSPKERAALLKRNAIEASYLGERTMLEGLKDLFSLMPEDKFRSALKQKIAKRNTKNSTEQEVPLDTIDEEFGTGDLLMNDRVGLDIDNPIGQAFEEDILSPSASGPQAFLRNLVLALDNNSGIDEAISNQEMAKVMSHGIGDQTPTDPLKKSGAKVSSSGIKALSSSDALDKDTMALMSALRADDISADALKADIVAGIGEEFIGRRPSMSLTSSGKFGGGSSDVAKAVLAQKIKQRNDALELQTRIALANQRAKLERERLGVENFKAAATMLDKKERQKLRIAKNKMSAARSIIKGLALENKRNVWIDPDTKQILAVKEGREDDFNRITRKIQLINNLIGSFADIDPELNLVDRQAQILDDAIESPKE